MNWTDSWNEKRSLPRAQHWATRALRVLAAAWVGWYAIESILLRDLSLGSALLTLGGAVALFSLAFILDAAICGWRVSSDWFADHLSEIAPDADRRDAGAGEELELEARRPSPARR